MKKWFLFLTFYLMAMVTLTVQADVDYRILSYEGDLVIHPDNRADFTQTLVFDYASDFNGQYVTLGTAGQVPQGFAIVGRPQVDGWKGASPIPIRVEEEVWHDGRQLKIYNGGQAGDRIRLTIHWQLDNVLHHYRDIAELNWLPISDWEVPLEEVRFQVSTSREASDSQLFAHQGLFKPKVTLQSQHGHYQFTAQNVDKLDIHAYWDQTVLDGPPELSKDGLPQFLATEAAITEAEKNTQAKLYGWLPGLGGASLLASSLAILGFRRSVGLTRRPPRRVYQIPEDLTPLEVSHFIYNDRLVDSLNQAKPDIPLEQVFQASLLDLIDRRYLVLDISEAKPRLIRQTKEGLAPFEENFLHLALAGQDELPLDQVFSDLIYDKGLEAQLKNSLGGAQLEREMRGHGNRYLKQVKTRLNQINQDLAASRPSWVSHYRPLSTRENLFFYLGLLLLLALGGLAFYGFFTSVDYGQHSALFYLAFFGAGSYLALVLSRTHLKVAKRGVLTPSGKVAVEPWQGFRQMLKDIKTFNRVDLEGLVVWNRVLVYATLFGQAKQVQGYITINKIQLPDQSGIDLSHRSYFLVQQSIHRNLVQSQQAASQASHFSVSNRSSGASSGFSGGGGGGGGGSF